MNENFPSPKNRLAIFRSWARDHSYQRCRLVYYCGFEFADAIDVPVENVEQEIIGCSSDDFVSDGLNVDWQLNGECLVIAIWESWDLPLDWRAIFEERDLDLPADDNPNKCYEPL